MTDNGIDPQELVRGIAEMHDRAAKRTRSPSVALAHEEAAMHLRFLSDDLAALKRLSVRNPAEGRLDFEVAELGESGGG